MLTTISKPNLFTIKCVGLRSLAIYPHLQLL